MKVPECFSPSGSKQANYKVHMKWGGGGGEGQKQPGKPFKEEKRGGSRPLPLSPLLDHQAPG